MVHNVKICVCICVVCMCVCVYKICCCCPVTKLCPTLRDLIDFSTPGRLPCPSYLLELAQTHVCWIGKLSNHLILCHPVLLLPSIFPNIRGFSTESALHIRWPKYWSFKHQSFQLISLHLRLWSILFLGMVYSPLLCHRLSDH